MDGDDFKDVHDDYTVSETHWTYQHSKPGHALQDEVSRVLYEELTKFYGLDAASPDAWKETEGYSYFKQAIRKFPEEEQDLIEETVIESHYAG